MAITTLSGVIDNLRPTIYTVKSNNANAGGTYRATTTWYNGGYPTFATGNTSGMSGQVLTSSTAAIPFTNPASGNTYLAKIVRPSSGTGIIGNPGMYCIVDRLWENSGIDRTLTTAQTVNSVTWPARDLNGSTNGEGVYLALEMSIGTSSGTPTITVSYTNSAGTSGRTGTNIVATWASVIGGWHPIGLQAGDTGVRSVQSITFSATWGTAGVLHLVAYRPICYLSMSRSAGSAVTEDALTLGMPQLWDNSVLQVVMWPNINGVLSGGSLAVTYTQG